MYYNLQVHSAYDLLNSTIKYKNLFRKLKKDNQQSVVIADPNMYGAIKVLKDAKEEGINVIHALEVNLSYGVSFLTFNILCKNEKMFTKLFKLSTRLLDEEEISLEYFAENMTEFKDDSIIILTTELADSLEFAYIAEQFRSFDFYFGYNENFNARLYENYENIIYTKPSYYLNRNEYQHVVVARAIRDNKKLNVSELILQNGENFVRTQEDFYELLTINEEKKDILTKALESQEKIINLCQYNLEFLDYHLPKYIYSEKEDAFKKLSSKEYLHYLVQKGLKKKLIGKDLHPYKKRFDYELKIIDEMGFNDYFLIVYDFVKYAKDNGIYVGAGRGSAAGSLVCYLLDITEADPLEYNLLFERFLNKERITMPDIDIDFQDTRRDEVIKYVVDKYGEDKVAQIITFTTLKSKSAARESARILQFDEETLKFISSNIKSDKTLRECYEESRALQKFIATNKEAYRWFKIALSLEGLPKNPSVHAAGVVISDDRPITDYAPLKKSNTTKYLTQWAMEEVEKVGLLKIDFLGIRYLTMVANIVEQIRKKEPDFDITKIGYNDPQVYKLFSAGKTEGIFQFESVGMKKKLQALRPTTLNDIVAMNALYRPGPMAQADVYIRRKHGEEQVSYPHPNLEKILKDTYGVIVYQEQIMLIAVNFAHMTLNEADNMRRAVSKKKKEDLEHYGKIFIEKSIKAGYDIKVAQELFSLIITFAEYGFNKSHAVVYSMLAYRLAYLKVYYTKYFMTALLNNVISNEQKINEYKQELKNRNISLVKPDVNTSLANFSVYKDEIVFALVAIKNVGYQSASEIVRDRLNFGKYQNIDDFLKRMNKKVDYQATQSLVKAGALDTFGYNRATLMKKIKDYYEDKREYINNVRAALSAESGLTLKVEEVEEYPISEIIKMEKEVTGTYFKKHPIQVEKEKLSYLPLNYIGAEESDSYVEIISKKEIKTKKGDAMAFLTVNDGRSDYSVTVFPNVYKYATGFLNEGDFRVMTLKKQIRNDKVDYILEKITSLKNYSAYCINNIKNIYLIADEQVLNFVKDYEAPKSKVTAIILANDQTNQAKKIFIQNEHNFVQNFLKKYPEKRIKIAYK